jgi:hypothetical protein
MLIYRSNLILIGRSPADATHLPAGEAGMMIMLRLSRLKLNGLHTLRILFV